MSFTSFDSLHDQSRVWIYRSTKSLTQEQVDSINNMLRQFVDQWTAHNQTLHAHASVYHEKFIVIFLDEHSSTEASGCSIDSQVRFIKEIGDKIQTDFFDRLHFDFNLEGEIISYHKDDVKELINEGKLASDSIVMDHLVKTKIEFLNHWEKPLSESWHSKLI